MRYISIPVKEFSSSERNPNDLISPKYYMWEIMNDGVLAEINQALKRLGNPPLIELSVPSDLCKDEDTIEWFASEEVEKRKQETQTMGHELGIDASGTSSPTPRDNTCGGSLYFRIPIKDFSNVKNPNPSSKPRLALIKVRKEGIPEALNPILMSHASKPLMVLSFPSDISRYDDMLDWFASEQDESLSKETQTMENEFSSAVNPLEKKSPIFKPLMKRGRLFGAQICSRTPTPPTPLPVIVTPVVIQEEATPANLPDSQVRIMSSPSKLTKRALFGASKQINTPTTTPPREQQPIALPPVSSAAPVITVSPIEPISSIQLQLAPIDSPSTLVVTRVDECQSATAMSQTSSQSQATADRKRKPSDRSDSPNAKRTLESSSIDKRHNLDVVDANRVKLDLKMFRGIATKIDAKFKETLRKIQKQEEKWRMNKIKEGEARIRADEERKKKESAEFAAKEKAEEEEKARKAKEQSDSSDFCDFSDMADSSDSQKINTFPPAVVTPASLYSKADKTLRIKGFVRTSFVNEKSEPSPSTTSQRDTSPKDNSDTSAASPDKRKDKLSSSTNLPASTSRESMRDSKRKRDNNTAKSSLLPSSNPLSTPSSILKNSATTPIASRDTTLSSISPLAQSPVPSVATPGTVKPLRSILKNPLNRTQVQPAPPIPSSPPSSSPSHPRPSSPSPTPTQNKIADKNSAERINDPVSKIPDQTSPSHLKIPKKPAKVTTTAATAVKRRRFSPSDDVHDIHSPHIGRPRGFGVKQQEEFFAPPPSSTHHLVEVDEDEDIYSGDDYWRHPKHRRLDSAGPRWVCIGKDPQTGVRSWSIKNGPDMPTTRMPSPDRFPIEPPTPRKRSPSTIHNYREISQDAPSRSQSPPSFPCEKVEETKDKCDSPKPVNKYNRPVPVISYDAIREALKRSKEDRKSARPRVIVDYDPYPILPSLSPPPRMKVYAPLRPSVTMMVERRTHGISDVEERRRLLAPRKRTDVQTLLPTTPSSPIPHSPPSPLLSSHPSVSLNQPITENSKHPKVAGIMDQELRKKMLAIKKKVPAPSSPSPSLHLSHPLTPSLATLVPLDDEAERRPSNPITPPVALATSRKRPSEGMDRSRPPSPDIAAEISAGMSRRKVNRPSIKDNQPISVPGVTREKSNPKAISFRAEDETATHIRCQLCDVWFVKIEKHKIRYHVLHHCPMKAYQCRFCTYNHHELGKIKRHQKNVHKIVEKGKQEVHVYENDLMSAAYDVWMKKSFPNYDTGKLSIGRTINYPNATDELSKCFACKKKVFKNLSAYHVVDKHMHAKLYTCPLGACKYKTIVKRALVIHIQACHNVDCDMNILSTSIDFTDSTNFTMKSFFPAMIDVESADCEPELRRVADVMKPTFNKVTEMRSLLSIQDGLSHILDMKLPNKSRCTICADGKAVVELDNLYDMILHCKSHLEGHNQFVCPEVECGFSSHYKLHVDVHLLEEHEKNEFAVVNRWHELIPLISISFRQCFPEHAHLWPTSTIQINARAIVEPQMEKFEFMCPTKSDDSRMHDLVERREPEDHPVMGEIDSMSEVTSIRSTIEVD